MTAIKTTLKNMSKDARAAFDNPTLLSDLPKLLPAMKLGMDIEDKLKEKQSEFALAIKEAIKNNVPYLKIVKEIKSIALENKELVEDNIGLRLTNEILNFQ